MKPHRAADRTIMREAVIESYLVRMVNKAGGEARKFVSPGHRHVPDRLVLWPGGRLHFVECKAPGKRPRSGQVREHNRLKALGFEVKIIDSTAAVNDYVSGEIPRLCFTITRVSP